MRRRNQAGQVLVLVALALVVLIGVMGLAIDMGYLRYVKRQVQAAADAAAVAGALELSSCGTGCSASITTAAQTASTENGFTDGQNGVTIGVQFPTPAAPDPLSADTTDKIVAVSISQAAPVHFARIFGLSAATISARADAKVSSNSNCVYALNTFNVFLGTITSSCGLVIEVTLDCAGLINAPKIGVVGGSGCPGATTIAMPAPVDPLAYIPTPAVGACGTTTASPFTGSPMPVLPVLGMVTFNPGVYCGGIQIGPGEAANFTPGTYILNGGLNVTGGVTTGTGVTFYNTAGSGAITVTLAALGSVSFTAPTSGTYEGVLFYQDPTNTQGASFNVSVAGTNLTGAYYFPSATISFNGTVDFGATADYTILDAQSISYFATIGFTINNNYSTLPDGSPIKGGATLVE